MKPKAQRIAIAEACGWKCTGCKGTGIRTKFGQSEYAKIRKSNYVWIRDWPQKEPDLECDHVTLPDYPKDLNAMHEAEKALGYQQKEDYARHLYKILPGAYINQDQDPLQFDEFWDLIHATAAQRAEAFLRTIGKWIEP